MLCHIMESTVLQPISWTTSVALRQFYSIAALLWLKASHMQSFANKHVRDFASACKYWPLLNFCEAVSCDLGRCTSAGADAINLGDRGMMRCGESEKLCMQVRLDIYGMLQVWRKHGAVTWSKKIWPSMIRRKKSTNWKPQQGLLATYLIPRCVGRGVKLGSKILSGAPAVRAATVSGNLEVWNSGSIEIREPIPQTKKESPPCPKYWQAPS